MNSLTRRQFCAAGGASLALCACGGGSSGSGHQQEEPPDLAAPTDLALPPLDLSQPTCSGTFDAGPATALAVGQAKFFACAKVYVLRDAGGIYALTAVCTHMHCTVAFMGSDFQCPCHMSAYNLNGAVISPPAMLPLQHFDCSFDASGNVIVDPGKTVDATTRLTDHD